MVTTTTDDLAAGIDRLPSDAAAVALGALFEGAPAFVARLVAARPFGSSEALIARARAIAREMPEAEQVELVNAHPRLGAPPGTLSGHSRREQGDGGLIDEAAGIAVELARLNDAYEARFGFRYCVFVAGRTRAALLPGFRAALGRGRAAELARALDAVVDIARDRLVTENRRRTIEAGPGGS